VVDHTDDSDGHADTLGVQMEEHKEADDGECEPRGT